MKKFICIVLCLSMMLSFAGIAGAANIDAVNQGNFNLGPLDGESGFAEALNNFDYTSIATDATDVFKMVDDGKLEDLQPHINLDESYSLDYAATYVEDLQYNVTSELTWGRHVTYTNDNGTPDDADDDIIVNPKSDISLAFSNVDVYLKRILNSKYGGQNLFLKTNDGTPDCDDYATAIASLLYNLFYPTENNEYVTIEIEFPGTQTVSKDDFYTEIVKKSGLDNILQYYWCNNSFLNINPVLYTLGVELDDMLEDDYKYGLNMGIRILSSVIEKILNVGPLNYALDLIWAYSRTYHLFLREPTIALFSIRIAERSSKTDMQPMTVQDLQTLGGLANFIFNDFDAQATDKLHFLLVPTARFGASRDTTELFLYVLTYLNINVKYLNNAEILRNSTVVSDIFGEDTLVSSFFKGLFLGEYTLRDGSPTDIDGFILGYSDMYKETIDMLPDDVFSSIKRAIEKILKWIADYFDNLFKILTGEKEFGS